MAANHPYDSPITGRDIRAALRHAGNFLVNPDIDVDSDLEHSINIESATAHVGLISDLASSFIGFARDISKTDWSRHPPSV